MSTVDKLNHLLKIKANIKSAINDSLLEKIDDSMPFNVYAEKIKILQKKYEDFLAIEREFQTNTLSTIDDSICYKLLECNVLGYSQQETRSGMNQLMSFEEGDRSWFYGLSDSIIGENTFKSSPMSDNWIKMECDVPSLNGTNYVNSFIKVDKLPNLKPNTQYTIVFEFRNVNITNMSNPLYLIRTAGSNDLVFNQNIILYEDDIKNGLKKVLAKTYPDEIMTGIIALRNFNPITAGDKFSYEYRISVLEGDYTDKDYTYEQFGISPSPDYPSKIKNVQGKVNLFNAYNIKSTHIAVKENGRKIEMPIATSGNGYSMTNSTLKELCPDLKASDTVYLFFKRNYGENGKRIYLDKTEVVWRVNEIKTITQDDLDSTVALYGNNFADGETEQIVLEDFVIRKENDDTFVPFGTWLPIKQNDETLYINLNKYDENENIVDSYKLCSQDEAYDEISIKDNKVVLTKRIDEYVLTGDESISIDQDKYYTLSKSNILNSNLAYNTTNLLCTHFKVVRTSTNKIGEMRVGNKNLNFNFDDGIGDIDNFKQWLKDQYNNGNPVKIQYILADEEEIDLGTISPIILKKTNYIDIETSLNTKFKFKYALNIKKYISNNLEVKS